MLPPCQNVDSDNDSMEAEPEAVKRPRRSHTLKVALKFPPKKSAQKRPASEPTRPIKESESDAGEEGSFLNKRALNIKENKAMVCAVTALTD